ncbi:MAG: TFIIB-type zinc ribbon-containing protein [Planctomycetota bacterium]|jgi:DNA-directed RNA polymerase subunit RPC12/RpoP
MEKKKGKKLACGNCGKELLFSKEEAGKEIECPECGAKTIAPNLADLRRAAIKKIKEKRGNVQFRAAERHFKSSVKSAQAVMFILAIINIASGLGFYFYNRSNIEYQIKHAERNFALLEEDAYGEVPPDIVRTARADTQSKILKARMINNATLIVSIVIAVTFGGCAVWARYHPLAATLTAFIFYVVLHLATIIISPIMILSGIILKVLIIMCFIGTISAVRHYQKLKVREDAKLQHEAAVEKNGI